MAIKASNFITLVDLEDVGRLSVYLTSNLPVSQIYNPNSNVYQPDWTINTLQISPVIMFNDERLANNAPGLVLSWKRKDGANTESSLTAGETSNTGILTVNQNKLGTTTSGIMSYLLYVTYTDPDSGVTINAQSMMSFTLNRQASELHYATIDGEQAFMYDSSGNLIAPSTNQIILSANLTNVTVSKWQYKNASNVFVDYPTTSDNANISSTTLVVKPSHAIFFNGLAVVKLITSDDDVTDVISITKIRDGASGQASLVGLLSNDSHTLVADENGNVITYSGCSSTMSIREGNSDVTSSWTIKATASSNVTGTLVGSTYNVTGFTGESGYVDFLATKSGQSNIEKRFSISKTKYGYTGTSARIYMLQPGTKVINKSVNGEYSPSRVNFVSYYRDGNTVAPLSYSGRFVISESSDGTSFVTKYTSSKDEQSVSYTPTSTAKVISCVLYASGGTTTALDSESVVVVDDGETGEAGLSIIVGNEAELITCHTDGRVENNTTISIPFSAYKGINKVAASVEVSDLPSGMSFNSSSSSEATSSNDGLIVLNIESGSELGGNKNGNVTLTFTVDGQRIVKYFSWSKIVKASDGTNAVVFEVLSPYGNVIFNGNNNVTLITKMYSGSSDVNASSYVWKKYESGTWKPILSETSDTLIVTQDMVESASSFSCTATYNNNEYTSYATVIDKQDNYSVELISSIGNILKNSNGYGVVYSRVYQNSVEVDKLKTTTFNEIAPTNPQNGDFYYHINKTDKTVTLKKYSGSSWVNATNSDLPSFTYNYYRLDKNSQPMDGGNVWRTGKAIYISGEDIDEKVTVIVEVEN